MKLTFVILVLLLLAAPAHALTLTSPAPNAKLTTTRPLFAWNLDGHQPSALAVSSSSATTVNGEFFSNDEVTMTAPDSTSVQTQFTRDFFAGTYFWNMSWVSPDFSASGITAVQSFNIAPRLSSPALKVRAYRYTPEAILTFGWNGNVERVQWTCTITTAQRPIKRVGLKSGSTTTLTSGAAQSETCSIRVPSKYRGKKLRATVTTTGGGLARPAGRTFLMPRRS